MRTARSSRVPRSRLPVAGGGDGPRPLRRQIARPDEATVRAAMAGGTFQDPGAHVDSLRAVLARAPARYPRIEKRGNLTIVRDEEIVPEWMCCAC